MFIIPSALFTNQKRFFIKLISVAVMLIYSLKTSAQLEFKTSGELLKAILEHSDAYKELNSLEKIVQEIDQDKKPEFAEGTNWNTLADKYKKATESIKATKLPTDIDLKPYTIPIDIISNCHLKKENIEKLNNYNSAVDKSVLDGKREVNKVNEALKEVDLSFKSLNYLIDIYQKISLYHIYGKLYTSDLFAILNNVKPNLGEYKATLNNYIKKLNTEIEKAIRHSDILRNNVDLLQNNLCKLEGTYKVRIGNATYKLIINRNGGKYFGSYSASLNYNIPQIIVSGFKLSFIGIYSYWDGFRYCCPSNYNFTGKLNKTFTAITLKDISRNVEYTLSR